MAQLYTHSFVQTLKSNLSTRVGQNPEAIDYEHSTCPEECYFQLLIFEDLCRSPKLVYGIKNDLKEYFGMIDDFPTPGVEIEEDYLPKLKHKGQPSLPFEYGSMLHWLLQTRKLSQMIAYTWLDPVNILDKETKIRVSLVKNILDFPSRELDISYVVKKKEIEFFESPNLDDLQKKMPEMRLFSHEKDANSRFLISPTHISYEFISLALLLCGQAFYKKNGHNEYPKYARIWEPISDIRQLILELGISVTWDTFYGAITDLSEVGKHVQNPYKKAIIPYPPRPSEFSLSQKQIKDWAEAPDKGGDYPFYPSKINDPNDWETEFVNPPTPYIPLSCL